MARTSKKHRNSAVMDFCLAAHLFLHASERFARRAGLTAMEYDLLLALNTSPRNGSTNIAFLAERVMAYHHAASTAISRLVHRGLLEKGRSALDRRSVVLGLTAEGKSFLKEITVRTLQELRGQAPEIMDALAEITMPSDSIDHSTKFLPKSPRNGDHAGPQ